MIQWLPSKNENGASYYFFLIVGFNKKRKCGAPQVLQPAKSALSDGGLSVHVTYLYAGSCVFSAQAAGQSPAAGGDVGHLGNGLHLLWTAYTNLQRTHDKVTCILFM